jgi:hypothetical protein
LDAFKGFNALFMEKEDTSRACFNTDVTSCAAIPIDFYHRAFHGESTLGTCTDTLSTLVTDQHLISSFRLHNPDSRFFGIAFIEKEESTDNLTGSATDTRTIISLDHEQC